jgi:predicted aspartyl protease
VTALRWPIAFFGLLILSNPAQAEDCNLTSVASLTLQPGQDRLAEFVTVQINGIDKKMLLDTGGYTSQLTPETVAELKLPKGGALGSSKYIGGNAAALGIASIADFRMGTMRAKDTSMMISPVPGLSAEADGLLANDLFLAYDLDMDFGHDKLNVISSDHCPGKVVYWKSDALAVVPMRISNGQYLINVTLDGRSLIALVDTGATRSTMGLKEVRRFFGLTPDSADMVPRNTNSVVATYMHKFGVLSFDGVEIHDPTIAVMDSALLERDQAATGAHFIGNTVPWDFILGMDMMRHLHIYVATKERKLYITPG